MMTSEFKAAYICYHFSTRLLRGVFSKTDLFQQGHWMASSCI